MSSYLRPDEKASQSDIERSKRHDSTIKSGVKTAAELATGLGGAGIAAKALGPLSSRIMPFINKYITPDLAIKGISKVSPEIGSILKKGMNQGLNIKDGLDFIKGQIEKKPESSKQKLNIIEQESPELHQFILEQIKSGRKPLEAAALAELDRSKGPKFKSAIEKLKKTHKIGWAKIVEDLYGMGEKSLPQQQPQEQEPMQPQQQSQQQGGQGQAALMSILQKIQQARGAQ